MSAIATGLSQESVAPFAAAGTARSYVRYRQAYFYIFLIALLLCWSPSKLAAYLAPWVALLVFLSLTRSRQVLSRLALVLAIWLLMLPFYAFFTPGFAFHSAVLSLLTYGSFIAIFAIPTRPLADEGLANRMLSVARWLLLFEGGWGIVQGMASFARRGTFDGAAGDAVAGTIRPFAVTPDFSNPMFAVNVAFLLILLFPSLVTQRKGMLAFGVGALSLLLASVLHVLLFLTVAAVIGFVFYAPRFFLRKRGCVTLIAAAGLGVLAFNLLSSNFGTLSNFARYTLEGRTLRAHVIEDVFAHMPQEYPWQPIFGLGSGQFSSRASLIGTGLYFGSPENPKTIPLLPQSMSEPFRKYILDLWLSTPQDGVNNSSTSKPYFSWLSAYTEWGILGITVLVVIGVRTLYRLLRLSRLSISQNDRLVACSLAIAIMFLFFLGMQENYWEVPQAVLVGMLLLKVQYADLAYGHHA